MSDTAKTREQLFEAVPVSEALPMVGDEVIYLYDDGDIIRDKCRPEETENELQEYGITHWLRPISPDKLRKEKEDLLDEMARRIKPKAEMGWVSPQWAREQVDSIVTQLKKDIGT